jgi:hypothetical protein
MILSDGCKTAHPPNWNIANAVDSDVWTREMHKLQKTKRRRSSLDALPLELGQMSSSMISNFIEVTASWSKDSKDSRDSKDSKDSRDSKYLKDVKDSTDSRDANDAKETFPDGYALLKNGKNVALFGHPSGKRFTSPQDFFPHLVWLYSLDKNLDCSCQLCREYLNGQPWTGINQAPRIGIRHHDSGDWQDWLSLQSSSVNVRGPIFRVGEVVWLHMSGKDVLDAAAFQSGDGRVKRVAATITSRMAIVPDKVSVKVQYLYDVTTTQAKHISNLAETNLVPFLLIPQVGHSGVRDLLSRWILYGPDFDQDVKSRRVDSLLLGAEVIRIGDIVRIRDNSKTTCLKVESMIYQKELLIVGKEFCIRTKEGCDVYVALPKVVKPNLDQSVIFPKSITVKLSDIKGRFYPDWPGISTQMPWAETAVELDDSMEPNDDADVLDQIHSMIKQKPRRKRESERSERRESDDEKPKKRLSTDRVHESLQCSSCGTTSTPAWRRSLEGLYVCNACGLKERKRAPTTRPKRQAPPVKKPEKRRKKSPSPHRTARGATAPTGPSESPELVGTLTRITNAHALKLEMGPSSRQRFAEEFAEGIGVAKVYRCGFPSCVKWFYAKSQLRIHEQSHEDYEPEHTSDATSEASRPEKTKKKKKKAERQRPLFEQPTSDGTMLVHGVASYPRCWVEDCGRWFYTKGQLRSHLKSQHDVEEHVPKRDGPTPMSSESESDAPRKIRPRRVKESSSEAEVSPPPPKRRASSGEKAVEKKEQKEKEQRKPSPPPKKKAAKKKREQSPDVARKRQAPFAMSLDNFPRCSWPDCDKWFYTSSQLRLHIKSHEEEEEKLELERVAREEVVPETPFEKKMTLNDVKESEEEIVQESPQMQPLHVEIVEKEVVEMLESVIEPIELPVEPVEESEEVVEKRKREKKKASSAEEEPKRKKGTVVQDDSYSPPKSTNARVRGPSISMPAPPLLLDTRRKTNDFTDYMPVDKRDRMERLPPRKKTEVQVDAVLARMNAMSHHSLNSVRLAPVEVEKPRRRRKDPEWDDDATAMDAIATLVAMRSAPEGSEPSSAGSVPSPFQPTRPSNRGRVKLVKRGKQRAPAINTNVPAPFAPPNYRHDYRPAITLGATTSPTIQISAMTAPASTGSSTHSVHALNSSGRSNSMPVGPSAPPQPQVQRNFTMPSSPEVRARPLYYSTYQSPQYQPQSNASDERHSPTNPLTYSSWPMHGAVSNQSMQLGNAQTFVLPRTMSAGQWTFTTSPTASSPITHQPPNGSMHGNSQMQMQQVQGGSPMSTSPTSQSPTYNYMPGQPLSGMVMVRPLHRTDSGASSHSSHSIHSVHSVHSQSGFQVRSIAPSSPR